MNKYQMSPYFEYNDKDKWKPSTQKIYNKIKKSMVGEENLVLDKRRNVNCKEKD